MLYPTGRIARLLELTELSILRYMAEDGTFVMALADPAGRLLWTCAFDHMDARAEEVNFVTGGQWDEASAGTNAVGLSLQLKRPKAELSAEERRSLCDRGIDESGANVSGGQRRRIGIARMPYHDAAVLAIGPCPE